MWKLRRPDAVGIAAAAGLAKVAVHLPWLAEYGYHRDELYFIDCGAHLALGYVDHAPLIPWIARFVGVLFEHDLFALRIAAVFAGALATAITVLTTRELGGGRLAQVVAGTCVLVAPAYLRMAKILSIPAIELLWWTLASYLVMLALQRAEPKRWLAVGVVAGVGLLTKHTMLLWGAGVAVGIAFTPSARPQLRTRWPYLGLLIALLLFAPNLLWQMQHDWATLEFIRNARHGMLARIPRALFVGGQFLYMNPLAVPIWSVGLAFLFQRVNERSRPFGLMFVTVFALLLVTRAKPYYLAAAYPMLFAAGAVAFERWLSRVAARTGGRIAAAWMLAAALFAIPLSLPILPLPQVERIFDRLFGWAVPPLALTHDLHDEFGWAEQVATVAGVYRQLPANERSETVILTGNYGQASAVAFFGPRHGLPRATSGHMTHYLWTDPVALGSARTAVAYGLPGTLLRELFVSCDVVARTDHPLALAREGQLPVLVCREPRIPLSRAWPRLRRFGNDGPVGRSSTTLLPGSHRAVGAERWLVAPR
jgi:4-amino-4-deoxy-L-arabinose transferase-like glycosyltransferase